MLPQKLENTVSENVTPSETNSKSYKEMGELIPKDSSCSCSQCDSVSCFEVRNQKSNTSCTCSLCKNLNTCGSSKKSVPDKKPNSSNVNNSKIKNEIEKIEKELYGEITKIGNTELDNREYTKFRSKDVSLKKDKMERPMKGTPYGKSSTRQFIHSVAINYLPKERKDSTAKLSAQIMNMPYQDFKDSLSLEDSQKKSSSFNIKKIVKPDFLTRLKEIYDACSCKVCECITGKSLPFSNDVCNCKPCDCDECTNPLPNIKRVPHDGCPCVKCDRKNCKGVAKSSEDQNSCSCIPCDCVKCNENFNKSCDCEPCQCVECKALGASLLRTLIVAPVHGNMQQNMCQCEPCECVNCTHNYSAMSSLRRQVSTEVISNTNCHCEGCLNDACQMNGDNCRCDMQNKIMKKPFERINRDYDIHRSLTARQKVTSTLNKNDALVTFALCNNNYSNTVSYSRNKCDVCQCSKCECFVCKEQNGFNKEDVREIHNEMSNKYSKLSLDSFNTCKCSPCACEMCNKSDKQRNITEAQRFEKTCSCNNCDCFVCKRLLTSKNNINAIKRKDTNSSLHETNNKSCEKFNFLKKGNFFTPSAFEANIRFATEQQSCLSNDDLKKETDKISYLNVPSYKSCGKMSCHQNVTACLTQSKHNNSIYDSATKFQNVENEPENIVLNNCRQNRETLKKSITFIKNCADINTDNQLCEIFNPKKQTPMRDIDLLDKYIHLAKSSSTNVLPNELVIKSANTIRDDCSNFETVMLDTDSVPYNLQIIPTDLVHTIDSENINFDDKLNSETSRTSSFKVFIPCDKITAPNEIEIKNNSGSLNANNLTNNDNLESEYGVHPINPVDSVANPYNGNIINGDLNDIIDFNSDKLDDDLTIREKQSKMANSELIPPKHKTLKSSKKHNGKKYIKMYSRLNKAKRRNNNKAKDNEIEIKLNEEAKFETKEIGDSDFFEKDVCPVDNDEVTECLGVRNETDLGGLSENILSTTSIDKIVTSEIPLGNIMETQTQNIDSGNNNDGWSIMKKNLYLSSPHVAKSKGICTIPAMEIDIKTSLKSISMQTSECAYNIGKSNGKHALTRLLIEVNNLLNSPLLQSSHSNKKIADLIQESNNLSKTKFNRVDSEIKNSRSDAMSQTNSKSSPIDKETCCNLIQSMEMLQRNMKHLMDSVLKNAVYKSELSTTKLNLVQGCTENIPKINSCNSSCHGLKATFIGLRTISDHTVMVKWRLPREVIYVQGYELQVDGRPVQKIFSPTRCMAILTCLPHSDKLLLTIRTLTTSTLLSDHQPATTIVYRPRVKCI